MKIRGKICCAALAASLLTGTAIPANAAEKAVGTGKYIALTFDDGPNTTTTNDVLDLLEEYGAKASFFLIGDNINEDSAKSVKRAFDMGCEICNHSKTHSNMGSMAADRIKEEIAYVDEWVEQITGQKTTFFRPPFIDVSQEFGKLFGLNPNDEYFASTYAKGTLFYLNITDPNNLTDY